MRLLFDIGGTKMRVAAVDNGRMPDQFEAIKTPKDFEEGMAALKQIAARLIGDSKIEAVAGGVAGPFDRAKTKLVNSPHLPDWIGKPLKKELEQTFGAPVFLENDAALAALGETVYGAGRGAAISVYVTVSTGVNGARIVEGRIDKNTMGFEIGHQILRYDTLETLEQLVSGSGVKKRFDKEPSELQDVEIWNGLAETLAVGLHNIIVHWSPEVLILGGSMILGKPSIPLERVRDRLQEISKIFPTLPEIKKSVLQDTAALYGALEITR